MEPLFIVDLIEESGCAIHDILGGLVFVEINLFVFHRFDEALRLGVGLNCRLHLKRPRRAAPFG